MRSVAIPLKQFGISFNVSTFFNATCLYCRGRAKMYFSLKTKVGKVLFKDDDFRTTFDRAFCSITCFKNFCFQEMFKNKLQYHDMLESLLNDLNPEIIVKEYTTCTVKIEKGFSSDGTILLYIVPFVKVKKEQGFVREEQDWTGRTYVFRGQDASDLGETLISLVREHE